MFNVDDFYSNNYSYSKVFISTILCLKEKNIFVLKNKQNIILFIILLFILFYNILLQYVLF